MASTAVLWLFDASSDTVKTLVSQQITHVVTLAAAGLALWGISNQIQSNVRMAERARIAKLDAARTSLPIVLSNIVDLCEERFHALANGRLEQPKDARWEITEFELSTLKECIEHATGVEKELMQQIIRVYQVLVVRWDGLEEVVNLFTSKAVRKTDTAWLDRHIQISAITDWVALKAISESLFKFARNADSNPCRDKMRAAVFSTMRHMFSGGPKAKSGFGLTNNKNFEDYLNGIIARNRIAFLDDDWN